MANDFVMEQRIESMVSPTGGNDSRRTAHFLKPSVASGGGPAAAPSFDSSSDVVEKYRLLPLKTKIVGGRRPTEDWKKWAEEMSSSHRSSWESAGILKAIMSSTVTINRNIDLIFMFLEKWCPTTNSFAFPWGEATLTMEDMAELGGFPVLGEWLLSPPDGEAQKIAEELDRQRSRLSRTIKSKKPQQSAWMREFKGKQNKIEHEAFLAYWLSRFVFPSGMDIVSKNVLPVAARLARGTKIAIAPAVLASIYKSLSSLKTGVVAARKSGANDGQDSGPVPVTVLAPLGLVQVWIWERFPTLSPNPKPVPLNEPRLARWDGLKNLSIGNLSLIIDSPSTQFLWRPYTSDIENVFPGRIYKDDGYWAPIDSGIDEDLEGFIRCVRTSELVGMDENCIEQYLPHRVAMQFGMDQDIPGHVARVNVNPQVAWSDYTRPVRETRLFIPSRLSEPQCTTRYLNWWKKLYQGWRVELRIGRKGYSKGPNVEEGKKQVRIKLEDDLPPAPGFSPKMKSVVVPGKSNNSIAEEASPRQSPLSSPVSGSAAKTRSGGKASCSKNSKRKLFDSSCGNSKISDYYAPVSSPGSALKHNHSVGSNSGTTETGQTVAEMHSIGSHHENHENEGGKDNLSSTMENENVDNMVVKPVEFKAENREAKGASDVMDVEDVEKAIDSLNKVQSSTFLSPDWVQQCAERIEILEKLTAWLKSGTGSDLPVMKNQT